MVNTFGERLNMLRDATKSSFDNLKAATGQETDPELVQYSKLKAKDFDTLTQQFGIETVTEYIKNMEHKKMTKTGGQ